MADDRFAAIARDGRLRDAPHELLDEGGDVKKWWREHDVPAAFARSTRITIRCLSISGIARKATSNTLNPAA
ncbi:hypothetical protein [Bradyrhizobium yuanmingense]|uniref:hypothetical protein n=1 Tax=Bradyrhizobium yuanmingense TaxID=108015 RepID=UPI000B1600F0|nr:hypothetical protein [Bradyrhizobium yuanmingense]